MKGVLRTWLHTFVWPVLFLSLAAIAALRLAEPFSLRDGKIVLQDLSYHVALYDAFWRGEINNFYDLANQSRVISRQVGATTAVAMPVGQTPSTALLFYPLVLLYRLAPLSATAFWNLLSLLLLWLGLRRVVLAFHSGTLDLIAVFPLIVILFSDQGFLTFGLGQSSLMAVGALLLLAQKPDAESQGAGITESFSASLWRALLFLLLSIKIPYLVIGCGILLIQKYFRALFMGAAIVALCSLIVLLKASPDLCAGYLKNLGVYGTVLPTYYAESVVISSTASLRAALALILSDREAALVCNILYLFGSILVFLCAVTVLRKKSVSKRAEIFVPLGLTSCYLLAAPYVASYEDLLLLLPAVFLNSNLTGAGFRRISLLASAILFLLLNRVVLDLGWPPAVFWVLKAAFLALCTLLLKQHFRKK